MPSLSILLAEDNLVNRKVATALLRKQGHEVTVVQDGPRAVAAVASGAFDLVLMDVQMPGLDGFEATRHIRQLPDAKGMLPVIGMTTDALKGDDARCRAAGMDDYVTMPIQPQALYAAIARATARPETGNTLNLAVPRRLEDQVGREVMVDLVREFQQNAGGSYLVNLKGAAAAGDAGAIGLWAHDIKSLAATFGLDAVAELARDIETAAKLGHAEAGAAKVADLEILFRRGLAALRGLYPSAFD